MREAQVTEYSGIHPVASGLHSISFASRPRPAGMPGLCQVDLIAVDYEPGPAGRAVRDPARAMQAPRAISLSALVSEAAVLGEANGADRSEEQAACRSRRPVLGRRAAHYFSGGLHPGREFDPIHAQFAVRAFLQGRTFASAGGRIAACWPGQRPFDGLCSDAAATLRAIAVDQIDHFTIVRCEDDPQHVCVTASQTLPAEDALEFNTLRILIATDARTVSPATAFRIRSVSLQVEQLVA